MLFLRRNENISWGGVYAFPGGIIEKQDYYERWSKEWPEFVHREGRKYTDFNKRIAAIRETFEEINYLLVDGTWRDGLREIYLKEYKSDFL